MTLDDLVRANRSYRRFDGSVEVKRRLLTDLVDLARLTPSSANRQPLKYLLSSTRERNAVIFSHVSWAGFLKDWSGPDQAERPTAYIVILGDTSIGKSFAIDCGIVMQTILLGAVERGLGGCIIGAIRREELARVLRVPESYEILHVVALGRPVESVVIDELEEDGDTRYYRDESAVHHVPKRRPVDLIVEPDGE